MHQIENADIEANGKFADWRRGLMLLIKPGANSNHENVVDSLDEAVTDDVKKYAISEPGEKRIKFSEKKIRAIIQ